MEVIKNIFNEISVFDLIYIIITMGKTCGNINSWTLLIFGTNLMLTDRDRDKRKTKYIGYIGRVKSEISNQNCVLVCLKKCLTEEWTSHFSGGSLTVFHTFWRLRSNIHL